jgi:hypothetical protein
MYTAIIMMNERSINGQTGKIISKWVTLANNAIPSNDPPQWDLDLKVSNIQSLQSV